MYLLNEYQFVYRYWGDQHDYQQTVVNIRRGGFVSKAVEDATLDKPVGAQAVDIPTLLDAPPEHDHASEQDAYNFVSGADSASKSTDPLQAEVPAWLDVAICVMDPFIHTKVSIFSL